MSTRWSAHPRTSPSPSARSVRGSARETVTKAAAVDGVATALPRITGYAQLVGPDGQPVGDQAQAPAFGLNWADDPALNPYRIVDGAGPRAADEIVIDRGSALAAGFHVGDRATVLTKGEPRVFTISGIASFGEADSAAGASSVLFAASDGGRAVVLSWADRRGRGHGRSWDDRRRSWWPPCRPPCRPTSRSSPVSS